MKADCESCQRTGRKGMRQMSAASWVDAAASRQADSAKYIEAVRAAETKSILGATAAPTGHLNPRMLYRREILKRLVACGGLALALLPCLQQSHFFCHVAGCVALAAASADAAAVTSNGCGKCCGTDTASPHEQPTPDHRDSWPCGPDCWCCQPPDPREAPRSTTESAKSRLLTDCVYVPARTIVVRQSNSLEFESFASERFFRHYFCGNVRPALSSIDLSLSLHGPPFGRPGTVRC